MAITKATQAVIAPNICTTDTEQTITGKKTFTQAIIADVTGDITGGGTFSGNASSATALATGSTTARQLADRFADVVNVKDFGAVGDGVTNDRAAIQAAIDSLGAAGGTVFIPNGMKCLIDLNGLIIKPNVSLVGPHKFVGSPQDNSSAPYNNLGGAIILDAATAGVSIYMKGGSSISGLLIYRKGMVFPVQNASAFTGTAIIAQDDDVSVSHSMILGFNKAYFSQGHQRARIEYVYMDNVNGIEIITCYDIAYISNCHAWPFASIAWGAGSTIIRSGTAYKFSTVNDWCKLTNCFSYGYFRGCQLSDVNSMTLLGCGFDNVPGGHPSSIGITIEGGCLDTRIIGCQCAAQASAGIFMDNETGWVTIESYNCWGGSTHGVLIYNGNAIIKGSGIRDVSFAVSTTSATSELIFDNNYCYNITTKVINATVNNSKTLIGSNNNVGLSTYINPVSGIVSQSVTPSGGSCNLFQNGSTFFVNGTNNFNLLNYGWTGRQVTLIFTGVLIVQTATSPTPNSNEMVLDGNFTTANGNSLTLIHLGNAWYEISRTPRNP
jgi:hypothetical protein